MTQSNIAILQTSDGCRVATILIDPSKPCIPQLMKWSMLFEASRNFPDIATAEAHLALLPKDIDVNPYIVNTTFSEFVEQAHQLKICSGCYTPVTPSAVRIG